MAFPSTLATWSNLYRAANFAESVLNGAIDASTLTITVNDASNFTTPCLIVIDAEVIAIASKVGNVLTASARGVDGSTAATHAHGSYVRDNPVAAHHMGLATEVIALEDFIGVNGSGINAICRKVTIPYTSINAASMTQSFTTSITISQFEEVLGVTLKHSTAFSGPSISGVICTVGTSADVQAYTQGALHSCSDAVADTAFTKVPCYAKTSMGASAVPVVVAFESFGANLSTMTAGSLDLWVRVGRMQ